MRDVHVDQYHLSSDSSFCEEDTHNSTLVVTCPRFILHVAAVYNLVGWFGLFALALCPFHVV